MSATMRPLQYREGQQGRRPTCTSFDARPIAALTQLFCRQIRCAVDATPSLLVGVEIARSNFPNTQQLAHSTVKFGYNCNPLSEKGVAEQPHSMMYLLASTPVCGFFRSELRRAEAAKVSAPRQEHLAKIKIYEFPRGVTRRGLTLSTLTSMPESLDRGSESVSHWMVRREVLRV